MNIRKIWYNNMVRVYPNQVVASFQLKKVHYFLIFLTGAIGFQNLMGAGLVMKARKLTFKKVSWV